MNFLALALLQSLSFGAPVGPAPAPAIAVGLRPAAVDAVVVAPALDAQAQRVTASSEPATAAEYPSTWPRAFETRATGNYFGARYYSSPQGRFSSVDPKLSGVPFPHHLTRPQSWNMYAYAINNPLMWVDPTGEDIEIGITFDGNFNATEKRKILKLIRDYLNKMNVGMVRVGEDKRGWVEKLKEEEGYFAYTVHATGDKTHGTYHAFFGNERDLEMRASEPDNFAAMAAGVVLHEVLKHQLKIGDDGDAFRAAQPADAKRVDLVWRNDHGTIFDHEQGPPSPTLRPIKPDAQAAIEAKLKPIMRKYKAKDPE